MMVMAVPYDATGRTKQKARTRAALIQAAREVLSAGVTPTVEQAADAAGVSRTTAYRYFPNQRALIVATFPEIATASLLPEAPPEDPQARLDAVVDALTRQLVEHEAELRAHLRLSLEPANGERAELPFRSGRAIGWIEEALAPLRGRLSEHELRRLVLAIRSAVGIEALVWLTDVAALSRDAAVELMHWSAQALLRSALSEEAQVS